MMRLQRHHGRMLRTTAKRAIQSLRAGVIRCNRWAGRFDEVIWLVGEGRSGTTWIANLINGDGRYRQLFEPIHPTLVSDFAFAGRRPYRRPEEEDPRLEAALERVFNGTLTTWWIDRDNYRLLYRGMIVKDIHANLLLPWAKRRFPRVKPILLVRNPFAVARSRRETRAWWPETPAAELLEQPRLLADHLDGHAELLARVVKGGNFIVNQIAAWAATHHVAFKGLDPEEMHTLLYEEVVSDPEGEMRRLDSFLGRKGLRGRTSAADIARPSRVSSAASVESVRRDPGAWRRGLSAQEIDGGLRVLDAFGFGALYGEDGQPVRPQFEKFLHRTGRAAAESAVSAR